MVPFLLVNSHAAQAVAQACLPPPVSAWRVSFSTRPSCRPPPLTQATKQVLAVFGTSISLCQTSTHSLCCTRTLKLRGMEVRFRANRNAENIVDSWLGTAGIGNTTFAAATDDGAPQLSKILPRGGIGSARLTAQVSSCSHGRALASIDGVQCLLPNIAA